MSHVGSRHEGYQTTQALENDEGFAGSGRSVVGGEEGIPCCVLVFFM